MQCTDDQAATPVELGAASSQTLGKAGFSTDLVREIPNMGIGDD